MNRAVAVLLTTLGVVKLGAPISFGVVMAARPTPHVLVAPAKHERGVAPIEAQETFVARPFEWEEASPNLTVANRSAVVVAEAPAVTFDATHAKLALARSMESLPICRRGDASGPGVAEITWARDGSVARVALSPPYATSAARACIARRFEQATVPSYDGAPQAMRVRFSL